MLFVIVALALFTALIAADADAETDAERLAEMFSPILILTEETGHKWGDIKVIKPEPVEIMGAQSADSLWISSFDLNDNWITEGVIGDYPSSITFEAFEAQCPKVDFSANKFAFFTPDCFLIHNGIHPNGVGFQGKVRPNFDYPGKTPEEWNDEYTGSGARAGANFSNTAYVHIYKRVVDQYEATYDSVTVLQYKYFYPYNHWWNSHEGDWQGIDVVVSSSDPNTATILGVEYRFHGAWLNYYKDWSNKPGLTDSFVFNPRTEVKLSPGPTRNGIVQYTHPVVYVGAGSHAAYPTGGEIQIYYNVTGSNEDEVQGAVGGDFEHMTHTGLVLSTQAPASGSFLWERYDLQLLPEPDLNNTDNMGLAGTMSWLGARIQWGTPKAAVGGVGGKKSPYGPYNSNSDDWGASKGWGELKFFSVGTTGTPSYEMHHRDLPYNNYHHWAIIGDETWSGTVSLHGDVVVFPGATLTIEPGTVVTFSSQSDRHRFKEGNRSLSELFVYGTLESQGASGNKVVLRGPDPNDNAHDWGGLRKMTGGTVNVGDHTTIRNTLPPPTIEGLATVSFAENNTEAVSTYAVTNPAQYTITWSVAGPDAAYFQIDGVGVLSFNEPPNHEQKALYIVDVVATDGSLTNTLTVQVTVTDVNDPGTVTLSTERPQAGEAITATLRDEDGIVGDVAWSQHYTRPDHAVGAVGEPLESTSPVITLSPLEGYDFYLRAVYTDPFGQQRAESVPTVLAGRPGMPQALTATPSGGQVLLRWQAPESDGGSALTGYEYRYSADGGSTWVPAAPDWTETEEGVTPRQGVPGLNAETAYTFEVRAVNAVGAGDSTRVVLPLVPSPPTGLVAQAGDGQVTLTWDEPGNPHIDGWRYGVKVGAAAYVWDDVPDGEVVHDRDAGTLTYTVENLTNGVAHLFRLRAVNARGVSRPSAEVPATPAVVCGLAGPAAVSLDENDTEAVATYTASATACGSLAWSLAGADAAAFALAGSGTTRTLSFQQAPDFETQSTYAVEVVVSAESVATTVSVSNVEEEGTVALTPAAPRVGQPVTAQLTDPDGSITGAEWTWEREGDTPDDWEVVWPVGAVGASAVGELSSYVPQAGDVGHRLRARVSYRDGESTEGTERKSTQSAPSATVVDVPGALRSVTATGENGQVVLRWQAPLSDGGSALTGYEYRYSGDGGRRWVPAAPDWTEGDLTTSQTIAGLTNRREYTFEVRAKNAVGAGDSTRVVATPLAMMQVVFNAADYTVLENGHALDAEFPNQAAQQVEVRVQVSPAPDRAMSIPITVTAGSAEAADYEVRGLSASSSLPFAASETEKTFRVAARPDADTDDETVVLGLGVPLPAGVRPGEPASATVTIYDSPAAPTGLTAQGGNEQVTLTWNDPGHASITGWQYQVRPGMLRAVWGAWMDISGSGASTTTHTVGG